MSNTRESAAAPRTAETSDAPASPAMSSARHVLAGRGYAEQVQMLTPAAPKARSSGGAPVQLKKGEHGPDGPGPGAPVIAPGDMSGQPHPGASNPPSGGAPGGQGPAAQNGAGGARDPYGPNVPGPGAPVIAPGDMSGQAHPPGDPNPPPELFPGGSRALNAAETTECTEVFAGSVNYGAVRITQDGIGSTGSTRTIGNTIHFELMYFRRGAGGRPTALLTQEGMRVLVHEMTHVWQYQNGGPGYAVSALLAQLGAFVTSGSREPAYDWRTAYGSGVPFRDWNPEQQASAVEDYNRARHDLPILRANVASWQAAGQTPPDEVLTRIARHEETMRWTATLMSMVQHGQNAAH